MVLLREPPADGARKVVAAAVLLVVEGGRAMRLPGEEEFGLRWWCGCRR
ncbi:hypothetical protein [Saccharothrix luteola]|nr:hypothetical protein [Saccharothrix luteola]MCC8243307.1 hypothetical protein [Saccharothrix luteola]